MISIGRCVTVKKFLTALLLSMSMVGSTSAQSVTIDGHGLDRDAAILDAEKAAVERVVGTMIDSQTLVGNYMLELQKIYSMSQGFVHGVDVLSESRSDDGVYNVLARIEVESEPDTDLISRLTTIMRLNDPRITVIILKDGAEAGTHDEPAESALVDRLLTLGFSHVVDADVVANLENAVLLERIFNGEKGLVGVGSSYGADYLVLGKTRATAIRAQIPNYRGGGGYQDTNRFTGNANLTARIIKLSTGDIIGTFSVNAPPRIGLDVSTAQLNAVQAAANAAADELEKKFKKLAMTVTIKNF